MAVLYDTHCHLCRLDDDKLPEILARAERAGVRYIMHPGTSFKELKKEIAICEYYNDIYRNIDIKCAVAIHPCDVRKFHIPSVWKICRKARSNKNIIAIGETGLDTHEPQYEKTLNLQIKSFINHISAAQKLKMPVLVHAYGEFAMKMAIGIMENMYKQKPFRAVFHCFAGDIDIANRALKCGFYISFSGIATFKNAKKMREIAAQIPLNRVLIETDAPFLAPEPMRGKVNEPSFVDYTARVLSDVFEMDYDDFCQITTDNALMFFRQGKYRKDEY